jgi:hypothetical protein
MSEPVAPSFFGGSRVWTTFFLVSVSSAFVIGARIYEPHRASRVISTGAAICALIGGIVPAIGSRHPRAQRWLLLCSLAAVGVVFGVIIREIVRGPYFR